MKHPQRVTVGLAVVACAFLALAAPSGASAKPKKKREVNASLNALGTYDGGGEARAEIATYDRKTSRLFVSNADENAIDVVDMSDPSAPTLITQIDMSPYGGGVNSVAVNDRRTLAVASEADPRTDPGKVVFFDTKTLAFQNSVVVGALPDMVAFTPNGRYCLTANEGEPDADYTIDPEGSISIINMRRGARRLQQSDVTTAGFSAYNGAPLDPSIRIFGPGATVAQDLEPEYIAFDRTSRTAFVTCQENNAVAIVDVIFGTVTDLVGLGFKQWGVRGAELDTYEFTNLPSLGTTLAGQDIPLGGFSGLFFEGLDPSSGNWRFITHPDRGPNAEPVDGKRPFPLPDFQSEWVRFDLDPVAGSIVITQRVPLFREDGTTPITGLPNLFDTTGQGPGLAYTDEVPVDVYGDQLGADPFGADMEGIVRTPDGSYWMCDEYRPALYHFAATGVLIQRYVPVGSNSWGATVGTEALPAEIAQRRGNRGFEAIAYYDGKIYGFVQSPIDSPDVGNDANSKTGAYIRIIEFDIATEMTTGQYLYVLDKGATNSDKIGDAVATPGGDFLVIERDSGIGAGSVKNIYRVGIRGATNLIEYADDEGVDTVTGPFAGAIDAQSLADLLDADIIPVHKEHIVDLIAAGYVAGDKAEGLAFIDHDTLAVLNDNDFGLDGTVDQETGLIGFSSDPVAPTLGIIHLDQLLMDVSDRDDAINLAAWNLKGVPMPDAIASYSVGRDTFLITANEGDSRDYDGYSEEARAKDLDLDPTIFPNAYSLQRNENLGRLKVTAANGDVGDDGVYEDLYAFGGRSFSILDSAGALVYDSGDFIARYTAENTPEIFNADDGAVDGRSDDKGAEPEGVAIGVIGKQTFAFLVLERINGVMIFDVTDPTAPIFQDYVRTEGDTSPEGVLFIPRKSSPIRKDLLVIANELSGTTTVYEVTTSDRE